jgi:hypothetical protein
MGCLLAEEPFFGFGQLFVVIIAFGGGGEIHIPPRSHADIAARCNPYGFAVDVTLGNDSSITAAADFGSLLAHEFVNDGSG